MEHHLNMDNFNSHNSHNDMVVKCVTAKVSAQSLFLWCVEVSYDLWNAGEGVSS